MADYTLGGNSESASNLTKTTIRIPLVDKQVALASQMKEIDGNQLKILLDVESEADAAEAAAKAYADTLVVGLLDDRGNHDASGNTFPSSGGSGTAGAIKKGDVWTISVAGTLGSKAVTAGDVVRALVDTPGQTEANWAVTENNIGYVPENSSNKSTDGTLASNSNTKYPTEQAVKTYADARETAAKAYADTLVVGLLDDRGNHDASGNTFPSSGGSGTSGAIKKGDVWTISVAGTLGSKAVTAGDVVRALVDTPGQTEANWVVTENNIGYVPENSSNKSTDGTLASNSNTKYPTEQAVKTYADARETAAKAYADTLVVGLLDDRGNHDASGNTFPSSGGSGTAGAIKKGDVWTISVAGTLGSKAVTAGDVVRALVDTPGQTEANWVVTENNIGYVPENSSNKSTDGTLASNSNTKYPTEQAVKTYVDTATTSAGGTEVLSISASSVQTNVATGASIYKKVHSMLRLTPNAGFSLQSINTTNWEDGKLFTVVNPTSQTGSDACYFIIENNNGASGTQFSYPFNGVPMFIGPGERATFVWRQASGKLEFFTSTCFSSSNRVGFDLFSDFGGLYVSGGVGISGDFSFNTTGGTGSYALSNTLTATGSLKPKGIMDMTTAASSNGGVYVGTSGTNVGHLVGGNGSAYFLARITPTTALSNNDASNTYRMFVGKHDAAFGNSVTDGVYWEYDQSLNTTWSHCTSSNGSTTRVTSALTVSITELPYLGVFCNGDWTKAYFFYSADGTSWTHEAAHTANIPTGTSRVFAVHCQIVKTAGTSARAASIDLMGVKWWEKRGS